MRYSASNFADTWNLLFASEFALSALIAIGIFLVLGFFCFRYRRRSPFEVPANFMRRNMFLEGGWIIIPTILALAFFVWGAIVYFNMSTPPKDSETIYIVGRQWMWKAQQPNGVWENNELHVPVGKPVRLIMTSEDVIHSFFIPAFRVKEDVLPGRYTEMWFTATKPGQYRLKCSEYCGTFHSYMFGQVIVMRPNDYAAWLSNGGGSEVTAANAGQQLFQDYGCVNCHNPSGHGPGPSFVGLFGSGVHLRNGQTVTADESYIRQSILAPESQVVFGFQPIMPSFKGKLDEVQILDLIAYIKSQGNLRQPPFNPTPGTLPKGGNQVPNPWQGNP